MFDLMRNIKIISLLLLLFLLSSATLDPLGIDTSTGTVKRWSAGDVLNGGTGDALTSNGLDQFAATTSAELAGVISDETGSGSLVYGTSPTFDGNLVLDNSSTIRSGLTATDNVLLQAYDVDGAAYTTFGTLTANNTPTFDLSASTTVSGTPLKRRYLQFILVSPTTDVEAATGVGSDFEFPFAGTLTGVGCYAETAGTTGLMTIDFNLNGSTTMTTNKITLDSTERSSRTALTAPALTTTAVSVGNFGSWDVDGVQTTKAKGLTCWAELNQT